MGIAHFCLKAKRKSFETKKPTREEKTRLHVYNANVEPALHLLSLSPVMTFCLHLLHSEVLEQKRNIWRLQAYCTVHQAPNDADWRNVRKYIEKSNNSRKKAPMNSHTGADLITADIVTSSSKCRFVLFVNLVRFLLFSSAVRISQQR